VSYPSLCGGCFSGNHSDHDRDHGIQPGLIGGTYCPCEGDCGEASDNRVTRLLNRLAERPKSA
jgi:hypothetical protein